VFPPSIFADPIFNAVFFTPSYNQHRMGNYSPFGFFLMILLGLHPVLRRNRVINTLFINDEVIICIKTRHKRTIVIQFFEHILFITLAITSTDVIIIFNLNH
jgi:hypothetical protein